jgi:tetratricopeptide (TPR) repeat protein
VTAPSHEWIVARRHSSPKQATYSINAHRNLRGPYTAAGTLIRQIVPAACKTLPELVLKHQLTLLSIAPEVASYMEVSPAMSRSFEFSREGNSRFWTLRLAHGITDFLLSYLSKANACACAVAFEQVQHADPLDREFIAVLLRRADPAKLLLRVYTSSATADEPLLRALRTYARLSRSVEEANESSAPSAQRYVDSDCSSDDPRDREAYLSLSDDDRRRLHAKRAADLASSCEQSIALGALPFHHEQARLDVAPLQQASAYCMRMGYYHAALDWAERALRLIEPAAAGKQHSDLMRNVLFSLLLLGRLDEVETLCAEVRSTNSDPALLAHCAYAMAILNARLYEPARRDYEAARGWITQALNFTKMVPDSPARVVNLSFLRNTLALVEMRQGRPFESIRLLNEGLEYLQTAAPEKYALESPILLQNRARLYNAINQPANAVSDYTALLEQEPSNSEAYFERGVIHQRSCRFAEALEDYHNAILWSPPYDEAYFNRAQTFTALGRQSEALADYDYVLELEPDSVSALANRACLLYQMDRYDEASADVGSGLCLDPTNTQLLCLHAVLNFRRKDYAEAQRALALARHIDPSVAERHRELFGILHGRQ